MRKSSSGGWRPRKAVLRRLIARQPLDAALDWLRFRLDTFPRRGPLAHLTGVGYQPLPWLGVSYGRRAEGSRSRWTAISHALDGAGSVRTALDLGANAGYFTIGLAQRGIRTIAVENDPVAGRTALYAMRRTKVAGAALLTLALDPQSVELLPVVDAVLFLSLWHHFVRAHGLPVATEMLRRIWARTNRVLFFDTGQTEMPPHFGLPPMEPDARTWLTQFLAATCGGGDVLHLGEHEAFDAERRPALRSLFAVRRLA